MQKFKVGDEVTIISNRTVSETFLCEKKIVKVVNKGRFIIEDDYDEYIYFHDQVLTREEAQQKFNEWLNVA